MHAQNRFKSGGGGMRNSNINAVPRHKDEMVNRKLCGRVLKLVCQQQMDPENAGVLK